MQTEAIGPTALLSAGAVFNLLFIVCLQRTWKYWNQLKCYVVMLAVGNTLEVLFTLTTLLGSTFHESWLGGDLSCKFLKCMNSLGPSLANNALAAAAIHVLLSAITGCRRGSAWRHGLVLGLFVLLSLPMPVSKIPIFGVVSDIGFDQVQDTCTDLDFFYRTEPHYRFYYFVAGSIALVFFPLIIVVSAVGGAVMINCMGSKALPSRQHARDEQHTDRDTRHADHTGNAKAETNSGEVTFVAILGTILMVLCVPLHVFIIFFDEYRSSNGTVTVYTSLVYVFYSKVSLTALVCVMFSYAYVYRRAMRDAAREPRAASERTKLVH